MTRSDLTAATARAVGTGLALVLPAAALVVLRLFPPLELDPAGTTAWLAPAALGLVALISAVSVVPLLAFLVGTGRLAAGFVGFSMAATTAGCAALALAGTGSVATFPDSGLAITLTVVAAGLVGAAWAAERTLDAERERWLTVIGALALAEAALAGALLAPGSALDDVAQPLFVVAGGMAAAGAAVWGVRRTPRHVVATLPVALAAFLLAAARPGTMDGVLALAPLLVAPPLLVAALVGRPGVSVELGSVVRPRVATEDAPATAAAGFTTGAMPRPDDSERLGRELRAALAELTDARHTIALQRAELERATDVDPLTGVASRAAIMDRLRDEVAEARRYPHSVSIVLVDVDHMGEINAAHGTAVGDAVLRELALRMRVRIREADAIGRVAGDAFVAVLPHTDEKGAAKFAEIIRDRATQRPVSTGRGEVVVTVSIGVTTMRSRQELTADTLLARADEAVASARAGGGNVIAFDRLHGLARLEDRRPRPGADDEAQRHTT